MLTKETLLVYFSKYFVNLWMSKRCNLKQRPFFSRIPPFELLKGPFRFEGRSEKSDKGTGAAIICASSKEVHLAFVNHKKACLLGV